MTNMASRLKKIREKRKFTLRDLAVLSNVDKGWISRIETGERQNISLAAAVRLADALHVSLDYLAGRNSRRYDDRQNR